MIDPLPFFVALHLVLLDAVMTRMALKFGAVESRVFGLNYPLFYGILFLAIALIQVIGFKLNIYSATKIIAYAVSLLPLIAVMNNLAWLEANL